jgi:hypothetical protein
MSRLPAMRRAVRGITTRPERCAGCGRPLTSARVVKDVDAGGALASYHQSCAPSLGRRVA